MGPHRSKRRESSQDFYDHRPYVQGDDLRFVDWRAAGRSSQLRIRQSQAESRLNIQILLDAGVHMNYGTPSASKWHCAGQLACAFAALAHQQNDSISFALGHSGQIDRAQLQPMPGGKRLHQLIQRSQTITPTGDCPWPDLLKSSRLALNAPGLVIILSDFLDPGGASCQDEKAKSQADKLLQEELQLLRGQGQVVLLLQCLHPDELNFPWQGSEHLEIEAMQHSDRIIRGSAKSLRDEYLERLNQHLQSWQDFCHHAALLNHPIRVGEALDGVFLNILESLASERAPLGQDLPSWLPAPRQ